MKVTLTKSSSKVSNPQTATIRFNCALGDLEIQASAKGVQRLSLTRPSKRPGSEEGTDSALKIARRAKTQIAQYIEGKRTEFDLPLDVQGTPFQRQVWDELLKIPFGQTRTYGQLARKIGNPKAARAVGMANNRNPVAIVVPCHRVVGSDGSLVGYAGGLELKRTLLGLENSHLS